MAEIHRSSLAALADGARRNAPLSFNRHECNPYALFEGAGLGPRSEFSWPALVRVKRPDLYQRVYGAR
jgi:hypothetical protein